MSPRANQSAATPVATGREQHRQRNVSLQPVQKFQHPYDVDFHDQNQLQHCQRAYSNNRQDGQTTYETNRAWARQNPEVHHMIHDLRLNQSLNTSGSAGDQAYGQASYEYTDARIGPSQHAQTDSSGYQQHSSSGLTLHQLLTADYGREPSSSVDTWRREDQRKGPWYGNVEQNKKPQVNEAQTRRE